MPDLDALRELAPQLWPPNYDDLVDVARKRRRRTAVVAAACATVVVLGAGIAGAAHWDGPGVVSPAQDPSPSPSESPPTDEEWPLERIRAEGSRRGETVTESGITTRQYVVCDGPRAVCENDPPLRVPYQHVALEVTQDGRSALFSMAADTESWVTAFDEESVFVMDNPTEAFDLQQMRYRLLRADGTEVLLQLLTDLAPAVPGPGVFVIDHSWHVGDDGFEDVYLVDEREGTLRPLDVPHLSPNPASIDSRWWGPNVDQFLWFADRNCTVQWANEDGTFEKSAPACAPGWDPPTYLNHDMFPDGWLQPGRMALLERNEDRLFLHVSLDYGSTWQRIPVSGEQAVPNALQQLG